MGQLIVTEFMTLDGVGQAPGAPDEDLEGGFALGGWQAPYQDRESGRAIFEQAQRMDALLLGRRTYELFAGYWPNAGDSPFKELLNRVPKFVASTTLAEPLTWQNSTLLTGDLAQSIPELTARHERVHVIGSLDLVQSLLRLDLIDQLHLLIYPLVLGRGKRVFAEGTAPAALRLTQSRTDADGALQLTYDRAGAPTFGTM